MIGQLWAQAEIVGLNSATALVRDDRTSASQTLAALRAEPHVLAAAIRTKAGDIFATYLRYNVKHFPALAVPPRTTRPRAAALPLAARRPARQ